MGILQNIIDIIVKIIALFYIALLSLMGFLAGLPTHIEINDMDRYLETDGRLSSFCIFPAKDEITGEVIEYHYRAERNVWDGWFEDEVYLEVVYSEENFAAEIERFKSIVFGGTETTVPLYIIEDDAYLFNYTTYISTYNFLGRYEYACVDPTDFRIVYITLDWVPAERITFDNKYLPKTYYEDESAFEYDIDPYCYDIYYFSDTRFYNMPGYSYELVPES